MKLVGTGLSYLSLVSAPKPAQAVSATAAGGYMLITGQLGSVGSGGEISQETIDEFFAIFDKNNSGVIEKPEMVTFIKQLLGR